MARSGTMSQTCMSQSLRRSARARARVCWSVLAVLVILLLSVFSCGLLLPHTYTDCVCTSINTLFTGAAPAPGQKSIIQFYSVAPPSARSQQAPPRAATPDDAAAAAEPPPHRSRSAPLPYQQQHAAAAGTRSPAAVAAAAGDGTSPRPSDLRSPSPDTSCAPFTRDGSGVFVIPTRLVGRQHQAAGWPPPFGAQLRLEREAHNPVDPCAILVSRMRSWWCSGVGVRRVGKGRR